jgi:hypothetical protein
MFFGALLRYRNFRTIPVAGAGSGGARNGEGSLNGAGISVRFRNPGVHKIGALRPSRGHELEFPLKN